MIIQCEKCSAKLKVDDGEAKSGALISCGKCKHVFSYNSSSNPDSNAKPEEEGAYAISMDAFSEMPARSTSSGGDQNDLDGIFDGISPSMQTGAKKKKKEQEKALGKVQLKKVEVKIDEAGNVTPQLDSDQTTGQSLSILASPGNLLFFGITLLVILLIFWFSSGFSTPTEGSSFGPVSTKYFQFQDITLRYHATGVHQRHFIIEGRVVNKLPLRQTQLPLLIEAKLWGDTDKPLAVKKSKALVQDSGEYVFRIDFDQTLPADIKNYTVQVVQ